MSSSRKSLLQVLPLILFLLAGQLQAQTLFTWSMTDESKYNATMDMQDEETFSHDYKACLNFDCNDVAILNTDLVIEPGEDLPQVFTTLDLLFQLQTVDPLHRLSRTNHIQAGSKIHLVTQRLRI